VLGVPFVWVLAGMALTEMSGMFFAMLGLYGLTKALSARTAGVSRALLAFAAGLPAGLAFFSRPPLILFAVAAAAALVERPRPWSVVLSWWAGVAVLVTPAVWLWGGISPPLYRDFHNWDFSIQNMLVSLGYGAVVMGLICPQWYRLPRRAAAVTLFAGAAASLLFQFQISVLATTASRLVPVWMGGVYPFLCAAALVGLGLLFVWASVGNIRAGRHEREWVICAVGMLLIVALVGKITHQYSSRYTGASAPLMVLAASRRMQPWGWSAVRLAAGATIGAVCLSSYFW
jgi:hypothetical protein